MIMKWEDPNLEYVSLHTSFDTSEEIHDAEESDIPLPADDLKTRFLALAKQWREETGMLSSSSKIAAHPACQQIIEMGEGVIPLILREMQERPGHWSIALRTITGENPVPPEEAGYVRQVADAWIQWGRKKGHIA